ncbi:MAG: bifunctional response regulator/alkaline phosphatase family protein [Bacteroidales bacterium]|nr:bifunctional response regulator/alkaline phosphatase family protein [Bacteroidales bacterium]
MRKTKILWVDDEIDLLRPHIIFLEGKGYVLSTASNGSDAIELVEKEDFDLIFLDENMPGLSGLETLQKILLIRPNTPVVMITKSEEEDIMDAAIGSRIADYLIKPVNPKQILLSIKKNIDTRKLITSKTTSDYQAEFSNLSMQMASASGFDDWVEIYKRLLHWELELDTSSDTGMSEVLQMQKNEAESEFGKFVRNRYLRWVDPSETNKPVLSPSIMKNYVFPRLRNSEKVVFLLIDNMRFDQWRRMQPIINQYYQTQTEELYCSILPTSTQYARNAIFSGLMPASIQKMYPEYWLNDDDEGNKNEFEKELLLEQLQRNGLKSRLYYEKIFSNRNCSKLIENLNGVMQNDLIVLVYNFVDMLSHANTDTEMVRELASTDSAYRSLTLSWFQHSQMIDLFRELARNRVKIVVTTDHGTIRVSHPVKVVGDRTTSKNLRYKLGKNLSYNPKEVFEITNPERAQLPKSSVSSRYIFALKNDFLAYPNNYNHYVKYYTNTYQHGGVSMEEMMLPIICLTPRDLI